MFTVTATEILIGSSAAMAGAGWLFNRDVIGFQFTGSNLLFMSIYAGVGFALAKFMLTYEKNALQKVNDAINFMKQEPLISSLALIGFYLTNFMFVLLFETLVYPLLAPFVYVVPFINNILFRLTVTNPYVLVVMLYSALVGYFFAYQIVAFPVLALQQLLSKFVGFPKPNIDPRNRPWGRGADKYGIGYIFEDFFRSWFAGPISFACAFSHAISKKEWTEIPQLPLTAMSSGFHNMGNVFLDLADPGQTIIPKFDGMFSCPTVIFGQNPQ